MKKKILVVILNNIIDTIGGAVTAFYHFTDTLIENDYEVVSVFSKKKTDFKCLTKENGLKLYNFQNNNFEDIVNSENPDLMIFFYPRDVLKTLKNNTFKYIPKILMNHTRPDFYIEYEMIKDQLKDFSCVQVLFDSFKPIVRKYFKGSIVTIGNEVPQTQIPLEKEEYKNIIYLSRIDIWKGHEFLIKSFAKIAPKYPDWKLNIYGQFDPKRYKKTLEKLIKNLNLQNQVIMHGTTKQPHEKLKEADFCVFPSCFEGFGLGLAEALSAGLPAIGFKGATGVNELIEHNSNGFLIGEDENELAEKIELLINNSKRRQEMGICANLSMKKYSKNIIAQKWINLIDKVLNQEELDDSDEKNFVKYENFSIEKIYDIMYKKRCISFVQKLFSISNLGKYKLVYFLGFKFKIKRL